ncbi:MAG: hypothetical protein RLZZ616_181 [Pseudomonadota bacterium]
MISIKSLGGYLIGGRICEPSRTRLTRWAEPALRWDINRLLCVGPVL